MRCKRIRVLVKPEIRADGRGLQEKWKTKKESSDGEAREMFDV